MDPAALQARIRGWMRQHAGVFHAQDTADGLRITETATGKTLLLHAGAYSGIESRANQRTGSQYLVLVAPDRPPLALADAGFVFALDPRNTGPLSNAPPVMSFRDFRRLHAHLVNLLDRPESRRQALDLMMVLIASLDGARRVGLPVEVEEGELETVLRRLEAGP